jgi:hypothetical protein
MREHGVEQQEAPAQRVVLYVGTYALQEQELRMLTTV